MSQENNEIERKFLVWNDDWKDETYDSFKVNHAYIVNTPEVSIRLTVRPTSQFEIYPKKSCICIKHPRDGLSRFETELDLDPLLGELIFEDLKKANVPTIQKTRHLVSCGNWFYGEGPVWEIDQFHTRGLEHITLAEIELSSEDEKFEEPSWLGTEVTYDPQYSNAIMASAKRVKQPVLTDESVDKNFMDNWAFLLKSDGSVNLDLLKYELMDFSHLINEVPKIYNHVAGLSKHMYFADTIIREADQRYWDFHRGIILDDIEGMTDIQEVIDYLKG